MKKLLTTADLVRDPVTRDLALFIRAETDTLFENLGAAKYALQVFLNISGKMEDSIRAVENQTSAEELKSFNRGTGHV